MAITAFVMATMFFVFAPLNALLASAGAAIAGGLCLFVVTRLPAEARYWSKGAHGERKTAEYLQPLLSRGFVVLHDRGVPGSRANIDHIAIGPSGVFVIETKYISGTIEILADSLVVSERDRGAYVDQVYREAVAVQIALGDKLNALRLTVTPVLCVHGARTPMFDKRVRGVHVLSGRELRKLAETSAQLLSPDQVQDVATFATSQLRAVHPWE